MRTLGDPIFSFLVVIPFIYTTSILHKYYLLHRDILFLCDENLPNVLFRQKKTLAV